MEIDRTFIKQIIESLIFVSERPITFDEIHKVLNDYDKDTLFGLIEETRKDFENQQHGIKIIEIAGGYQFATDPIAAPHLSKYYKNRQSQHLTKASLETLAIIAYRQPITKSEIEAIRGVNVDGSIRTLLDRNLLKIVGRKDVPGRPILYGTTKKFLEHFGLNSLEELPQLPEFTEKDLEFARDDSLKVELKDRNLEGFDAENQEDQVSEGLSEEEKNFSQEAIDSGILEEEDSLDSEGLNELEKLDGSAEPTEESKDEHKEITPQN